MTIKGLPPFFEFLLSGKLWIFLVSYWLTPAVSHTPFENCFHAADPHSFRVAGPYPDLNQSPPSPVTGKTFSVDRNPRRSAIELRTNEKRIIIKAPNPFLRRNFARSATAIMKSSTTSSKNVFDAISGNCPVRNASASCASCAPKQVSKRSSVRARSRFGRRSVGEICWFFTRNYAELRGTPCPVRLVHGLVGL